MGNVEVKKLKKLRSVDRLFSMVKDLDPETDVTPYLVRKLVYEGEIPSVKCGNKRLAAFEDLVDYFSGKRWE